MIIVTSRDQETFALGQKIASHCKGGEFIALTGELGSGKTKLVQGLAAGLGVKGRVNSPTFNILKLYRTGRGQKVKNLCHIDAYRLVSSEDLAGLGVEEFINAPDTVVAIEWADKVKKIWPDGANIIATKSLDVSKREFDLSGPLFSDF